jgi:hypothetical protein
VNLGEVRCRAIHLLDGLVGHVGNGHPRGYSPGVVWGVIAPGLTEGRCQRVF